MLFVCYSKCGTCKKAQKHLDALQVKYVVRDIKGDNPSRVELESWWKMSGLPLRKFFNTSGKLYKEMDLKTKLDSMTDEEMLDLLATDGMLVKRPILVNHDIVFVGYKEDEYNMAQ